MNRQSKLVLLLLAFSVSAGCVTKKKYDALQRDLDASAGALAASEGKVQSLEEALAAEEVLRNAADQKVMDLGAQIIPLEDELAQMRDAKDQSDTELAAALASKKNMRASIDEMKRALEHARQRRAAAERRISAYKSMLRKFKTLIDAGKLQVQVVDGRMVLVLPTDVLFGSGSAKLSETGASAIAEVGVTLATMNERRFQVEGHTDTDPISTSKYPSNWELASARALGVARALLAAGVQPSQISAASHGEHRPKQGNENKAGKAANRRIEIVIVPDLAGLPGFDELNELAKPESIPPR